MIVEYQCKSSRVNASNASQVWSNIIFTQIMWVEYSRVLKNLNNVTIPSNASNYSHYLHDFMWVMWVITCIICIIPMVQIFDDFQLNATTINVRYASPVCIAIFPIFFDIPPCWPENIVVAQNLCSGILSEVLYQSRLLVQ